MTSEYPLVDHEWENVLNRPPLQSLKKTGMYRARVIETNDPLNMNRLRVIIPELHDANLDPKLCPWACPAPQIGGRGAFYFVAGTIGDWVWIRFEKDDPHTPVYLGFANPTRTGQYSIQQIHTETLPVLKSDGQVNTNRSADFDPAYLPKDGRPMKTGWVDTYGNTDMSSAVGYFPVEHQQPPAPADLGTSSGTSITRRLDPPEVNNPDLKYMLRMTKYGHVQLMSDQGYYWYKDPNSDNELGEFTGDREQDYGFEAKRWLNIQRLISEDDPTSRDRRRQLFITRYGSLFDMRDVGWGQLGPIPSKSRPGEYGPPRHVSDEEERDQRFMRMRSKGGMYFIMGDRGFHPAEDRYVQKRIYDDLRDQDRQLERYWGGNKDARFVALMTRYGWKFLLDDRGSDARNADLLDRPRGLGMLLKGRRRPGTGSSGSTSALGDNRGFFFQIMEKDNLNSLMMGSPMGHAMEMSDKYQYFMMSSTLGRRFSRKWKGFKDHEYNRLPLMGKDAERKSHHLKLDHQNEYVRLKTRGGRGYNPINGAGNAVARRELQQGMEARDTARGDGPWVELVDSQHRGLWMSKFSQLTILRGKKRKSMYLWINDATNEMVVYNNEFTGQITLYSNNTINLRATQNLNLQAGQNISLRAQRILTESTLGGKFSIGKDLYSNTRAFGLAWIAPIPIGLPTIPVQEPLPPSKIEPSDRGKTYNGPFEGLNADDLSPEIDSSSQ